MQTLVSKPAEVDRAAIQARYLRNRQRSADIFSLVDPSAYFYRPIPLRHPFAFYEGHLPAFSFLTLNERSLNETPLDRDLEKLFERGIDPESEMAAAAHAPEQWPDRTKIATFARACDARVLAAFAGAVLEDPHNPRLVRAQAVYNILEHEEMHHETLLYIVHQLPYTLKSFRSQTHRDEAPPRQTTQHIEAGIATLGAEREAQQFGWDNEFASVQISVPAFEIDTFPVTNAAYLEFVNAGAAPPTFWIKRDGEWKLRAMFEELRLPLSWPVYVTHAQAEAYARWKGTRLPTEPQYHRAAFGTPEGSERPFPWGSEPPQPDQHGNFGLRRYDPEPVNSHPAGASAWGVHDLVGNGWEWTATPFGPLPGFEPMASYPQYSADFFDNLHYVMKGASPVTAREHIRRTFRNWYRAEYPFMYAKFRCLAG